VNFLTVKTSLKFSKLPVVVQGFPLIIKNFQENNFKKFLGNL
jgi:hypothetical protein